MPNYKVHQAVGIGMVFFALFLNQYLHLMSLIAFGFLEIIITIGIALFYSILPDVDIGTSKSRKLVLGGALLLIIYCFITGCAIIGTVTAILLLLMIFLLNHRGRTHTTIAGVLFSLPLLYIHWTYMLVGIIAYLSHLLIDGELKWK